MKRTGRYIVKRLSRPEWGPTDRSYQEDLGFFLVPRAYVEANGSLFDGVVKGAISLNGFEGDFCVDDEVELSWEILSRVVTERRPL